MTLYVHGYEQEENSRLQDQASVMGDMVHGGTVYPIGSRVLEVGCGIGAQTMLLAKNSPGASITSIDISADSLLQAKDKIHTANYTNVHFQQANILQPQNFKPQSFDHVFVCFVLEHLEQPGKALQIIKSLLRPGGTITLFEGDHGSAFFYPDSDAARATIHSQVKLQSCLGGNALIGRSLYQLLIAAGYNKALSSPKMIYADATRPDLVNGFVKKTYTKMIENARALILQKQLIDTTTFDKGIRDLLRTTKADGSFCFTFFKATGQA